MSGVAVSGHARPAVLCTGLMFVASQGFYAVRPAWEFRNADPQRYASLMVASPYQLGWRYIDYPVSVMVLDEAGSALAIGWAGSICRGEHDQPGVNLAYAVAGRAQGRGFATLATAQALLQLARTTEISSDAIVQAQFVNDNPRSGAVAARLGLEPDDSLKRSVPITAHGRVRAHKQRLLGMSAPWPAVVERARQLAGDAEIVPWVDYAAAGEEDRQWPRSRMS